MSRPDGSRTDVNAANRELGLLLRRRPTEDAAWREFWIILLPVLLPVVLLSLILDAPLFSTTMLLTALGAAVWMLVLVVLLRHFRVVRSSRGPSS